MMQQQQQQSSLGRQHLHLDEGGDQRRGACCTTGATAASGDNDCGSATGDACAPPPTTTVATEGAGADLVMHDAMDCFLCPMSCCDDLLVLHGAGGQAGTGSCCGSTASDEYGSSEEDGATWGSLWNLDGAGEVCTLW
jgi:transcription factor MYB, plant